MINKLLAQLKIIKLSQLKPNFSELARLYGFDRRTVKKYYDEYEGKPSTHDKPSKLDPYKQLIQEKLLIKGTTIRAVYEFIYSEKDSTIGTYSNFIKYVTRNKLVPKKCEKGHSRFETAPGHQHRSTGKKTCRLPINMAKSSPYRCLIINWGILDTATSLTKPQKQDRMYSIA